MLLPKTLFQLSVGAVLCQLFLSVCSLAAVCPTRCICPTEGKVDCAKKAIRQLPIDAPSKTHILVLSSNLISSLNEEYFQDLAYLRELFLDGNRIASLPEAAFRYLERLEALHLQNNMISKVAEQSFAGLDGVTELNLEGNRIATINRDAFADMRSLEKLILSGNNLKANGLPEGLFKRTGNLRWLGIRDSGVATLPPGMFRQLSNLTVLDLSENPGIHLDMPSLFSSLERMETLSLERCELKQIHPRSFVGTTSLVELRLGSNSFKEALPLTLFESSARLKRLQLGNNSLTYLQETLFDGMGNLEYVDVANNPWHCGCEILGFRARWPQQPPRFLPRGLTCQSPESLLGRDLWSVPLQDIYTSCATVISNLSTLSIRGKNDSLHFLNCPVVLGSHVAWLTPNAEYITTVQTGSSIAGASTQINPHKLFRQNGTLLVHSVEPGTYLCSVTFANGTSSVGGVQVVILPMEYPDQSDIVDTGGKTGALAACLVLFMLGVVTLASWATWRICRRHRQNSLMLKTKSFMDKRPQAEINSDMIGTLTYDYAYAHPRAKIDMTSDDSAYAVGPLWEEQRLVGKQRRGMRPASRSVHERGPKYYNEFVRTVLPRTSHTISAGEVNGYITPSQLPTFAMSMRSIKQKVKELTDTGDKHVQHDPNALNADHKAILRPDSSNNRYLEIM